MLISKKSSRSFLSPNFFPNPFRPSFRVAVLTSRGNFRTTPPRIEGVMSPLDCRIFSHSRRLICLKQKSILNRKATTMSHFVLIEICGEAQAAAKASSSTLFACSAFVVRTHPPLAVFEVTAGRIMTHPGAGRKPVCFFSSDLTRGQIPRPG